MIRLMVGNAHPTIAVGGFESLEPLPVAYLISNTKMFATNRFDPPKSPLKRGTFQAPPCFPPIGGDQGGEGAGGDPVIVGCGR